MLPETVRRRWLTRSIRPTRATLASVSKPPPRRGSDRSGRADVGACVGCTCHAPGAVHCDRPAPVSGCPGAAESRTGTGPGENHEEGALLEESAATPGQVRVARSDPPTSLRSAEATTPLMVDVAYVEGSKPDRQSSGYVTMADLGSPASRCKDRRSGPRLRGFLEVLNRE
jgi:hypothetical protein